MHRGGRLRQILMLVRAAKFKVVGHRVMSHTVERGEASRRKAGRGLPVLHQQTGIGHGSGYNGRMRKSPRSTAPRYTAAHASAGLDHDFPEIETWPNQFPGYEIVVDDPEFTSVCPKTGLPDFGNIVIRYVPDRLCLELKSLKEYLQAYRNLGIFQENIVNQVLEDVVRWAKPVWAEVKGEFRPRGGISTVVIAKWPRGKRSQR